MTNSAEEELEAAMWAALMRHKVTVHNAAPLMSDLMTAAMVYAAADSDALTALRREVLHEATAPSPRQSPASDAPGGSRATPRELDPPGSRARLPEKATLSTGHSVPSASQGPVKSHPQAVDKKRVR